MFTYIQREYSKIWIQCLCPLTCRVPVQISNQCRMDSSALKASSDGPLTFTFNKLFKFLLPSSVLVESLILFMWLNNLSTMAVLIEIVSIISTRGKKWTMLAGGRTRRSLKTAFGSEVRRWQTCLLNACHSLEIALTSSMLSNGKNWSTKFMICPLPNVANSFKSYG